MLTRTGDTAAWTTAAVTGDRKFSRGTTFAEAPVVSLRAATFGWARQLVSWWRAVEMAILQMRDEDARACPICVRRAPDPDDLR
jgi:hypothetical protein